MTAIAAHPPGAPARNGLTPARHRPYVWRARRPAWMYAALAKAEAEHGPPVPTCLCGQWLILSTSAYTRCGACGKTAFTNGT